MKMNLESALSKLEKQGILLVFPIKNQREPNSLWQEIFPRKKMIWEWDDSGDKAVHDLWFLREQLSVSRKAVYSKWYQGRATLFSPNLFKSLLRLNMEQNFQQQSLTRQAKDILDILNENSPLSTKQLKRVSGLVGKENEAAYNRALKELWSRFLIIAFGEVDEGAFPSIAIGSTQVIFENLWNEAAEQSLESAKKDLEKYIPQGSLLRKYYDRTQKGKMNK